MYIAIPRASTKKEKKIQRDIQETNQNKVLRNIQIAQKKAEYRKQRNENRINRKQ